MGHGDESRIYRDVNPLLTPPLLLNQTIEWTPTRPLTLGATGRYAGKSYLDNTNDDRFTTPSFFTLETSAAYSFAHGIRVRLQVNNALNNKRVWPSGYSYLFLTPQKTVDGISYYYPQATRNAVVMVEFTR